MPQPSTSRVATPPGGTYAAARPHGLPPVPHPRPQRIQPAAPAMGHPMAAAQPAHTAQPAPGWRTGPGGPAGPPAGGVPVTVVPSPTDGHDGAWALVKAAQNGDQNAFGELFDRYYDMVFRFALVRMNGDRAQAEDIASETFVRALRRIGSVTYQGRDIGAWFVTIAKNLIFDHVKSSRYRLEQATDDMVEHSPTTHGPEQQVLEGATTDELLRCIRKLNADQQECITLRFLQGLSVAETAALMNRQEGAVKALQHRAVRRLAQLLPEGIR
jgi:RNA polymerase sigma-70 factor, ECF subfamily